MVWHAHMLNPRAFLEDCIRYGKMSFWATEFPLAIINDCIHDRTLAYDPREAAQERFITTARRSWDNRDDPDTKAVICPRCKSKKDVPWTARSITSLRSSDAFRTCHGFADKNFNVTCSGCRLRITHEALKVAKFREDLRCLLDYDRPMPGTFYNARGMPEGVEPKKRNVVSLSFLFPNQLLKVVGEKVFKTTSFRKGPGDMSQVRDELQAFLFTRKTYRQLPNRSTTSPLRFDEKVAFRRMMSRYWDNVSQFSMDLVGAVIRQGTFIEKMDRIDWLHSPTVMGTMERLIEKYRIFFEIVTMATNQRKMAVPTLDVDLAWHTHQLSPFRYYEYSTFQTSQDNRSAPTFIDHDDKVDETRLSDGFEWTSAMYTDLTHGQIYSQCSCWYCEATRASQASSSTANLHNTRLFISEDPDCNAHISAHNAVATISPSSSTSSSSGLPTTTRQMKTLQLRSTYERECRRTGKEINKDDTDTTMISWGIPFHMGPYYAPYVSDPSIHSDAYASNPTCMNLIPGGYGNCAAGTCGGAVAAGGCGSYAAGCASGGAAGGCGGC